MIDFIRKNPKFLVIRGGLNYRGMEFDWHPDLPISSQICAKAFNQVERVKAVDLEKSFTYNRHGPDYDPTP